MTVKEKCAAVRMFADPADADHGSSACVCPIIEKWEAEERGEVMGTCDGPSGRNLHPADECTWIETWKPL